MQLIRNHTFAFLSAFTLIVLIAFYWPWLSGQQAFYIEDLTDFFQPLCTFIGDALRQGHFPLWNPYAYCGMSQAAISSPGLFHPFTYLFALMDFSAALAVTMIISQFACAAGMYLLVRDFGWSKLGAAIAACGLAFSGYMFSMVHNYTLVASAAFLPLVLYCIRKVVACDARRSALWIGGLAFSLFMLVIAGRPEIALPGLILALAYAAYMALQLPADARVERAMNLFKAFLIGALLTMPSTLPLMEWTPLSRRGEGLLPAEVLMFSANWFDFIQMFAAHPFGNLMLRGTPLHSLVIPGNVEAYYGSAFVGAPVIALAILGLLQPGGRLYWLAVSALVLSILASLGGNVPGASWLVEHISALSALRFPCKLLFFVEFMLALFAARGANLICGSEPARQPKFVVAISILGVFLLWGLAGLALQQALVFPFLPAPNALLGQHDLSIALIIASALGIATLLVVRQRILIPAIVVLVAIALLTNAFTQYRIGARPDYFKLPVPLAKPLQNDRMAAMFLERFTVPPTLNSPNINLNTINSFQYRRQSLRPFSNVAAKVASSFGFEGSMVGEYYYLISNAFVSSSLWSGHEAHRDVPVDDRPLARILRSSGTRYVLTQDYTRQPQTGALMPVAVLDAKLFTPRSGDSKMNLRVYELNNRLPRAFLSPTWHSIASRDEVINTITSTDDVVVETDAPSNPAHNAVLEPVSQFQEPTPEHIGIMAHPNQRSLLVLADQFYPGWVAAVDGQPTQIYRCNGFFRGVFVDPGVHRITFDFDATSLKRGLLLAAIGLIWWLILVISPKLRPLKS